MLTPTLHIMYAHPLDMSRRGFFEEQKLGYYPSADEVRSKVVWWRKLWEELNEEGRVFTVLTTVTGVTLSRDLELYVFGAGLRAMSAPLIMPVYRDGAFLSDDDFRAIVIHEIVHRFVAGRENNPGIEKYWEVMRAEYAGETRLAQNHIIVYAVLQLVYTELFGEEKAAGMMSHSHPDYLRAIVIVAHEGAQRLVEQFRGFLL